MAAAAVEVAELGAPEAEVVGEKALAEAEKLGSRLARKVEKKISTDAAPAGRDMVSRLVDVGTGVAIGQGLQGSRGQKAAEGVTRSLAAARQPTANGGGVRFWRGPRRRGPGAGGRADRLAPNHHRGFRRCRRQKARRLASFWTGTAVGALWGATVLWASGTWPGRRPKETSFAR